MRSHNNSRWDKDRPDGRPTKGMGLHYSSSSPINNGRETHSIPPFPGRGGSDAGGGGRKQQPQQPVLGVGTRMLRGVRRSPRTRQSQQQQQQQQQQYKYDNDNEFDDDEMENEEDFIRNDSEGIHGKGTSSTIELTTSKKSSTMDRHKRDRILASVGLSDESHASTKRQGNHKHGHRESRRDCNNRGNSHKKLTSHNKESGRIKRTNNSSKDKEDGIDPEMNQNDNSDDDIEGLLSDDDEDEEYGYESYNSTNSETQYRLPLNKLLLITTIVIIIVFLFNDDEELIMEADGINNEEDVVEKDPFSFMGYKDQRIPDDDVAQFGGGLLLGSGGWNVENSADNDEDHDKDDKEEEIMDPLMQEVQIYHEKTGVFQTDQLWQDLDGYAELAEPFDMHRDLPIFWHVPKCGGTTLQDIMMHCFGMIGANEIGKSYVNDAGPLEVVKLDNGNRYVNVDMTNPAGIQHAKDLGFGHSGLADVVMTSWFYKTGNIFKNDGANTNDRVDDGVVHRGRCFALLRHPVERAISMFYYLKDATWEHTFSEAYENMTIEQYAASQYAEENWMGK